MICAAATGLVTAIISFSWFAQGQNFPVSKDVAKGEVAQADKRFEQQIQPLIKKYVLPGLT